MKIIIYILSILLLISIVINIKCLGVSPKTLDNASISFEKKQECAKYKAGIESKFENNNNAEIVSEYYNFDRIFYSPKADSCLYVYSNQYGLKADDRYRTLFLADVLTNKVVVSATVTREGKNSLEDESFFRSAVAEYEPE